MQQVDGDAGRLKGEADEPGWEVDPDDDWGVAVVATVGRQLKLRREAVGMRAAEFGKAVGYGEDMVYKIEGGKRIPRPEYLDQADEVLGAGGLLSAMKEDVAKVRYPKKVRELAKLEAQAVEIGRVQQPQPPWPVADAGARAGPVRGRQPALLAGRGRATVAARVWHASRSSSDRLHPRSASSRKR